MLEPSPGEIRLWRETSVQALLADGAAVAPLRPPSRAREFPSRDLGGELAERIWEREWLRDFHARRFGRRLWICPRHEPVSEAGAAVVTLDPDLPSAPAIIPLPRSASNGSMPAFGEERVVDYGCGSGILGIAALKLGAALAHGFDIDPQALLASAANAAENAVQERFLIHSDAATLPRADVFVGKHPVRDPHCARALAVATRQPRRPAGRCGTYDS